VKRAPIDPHHSAMKNLRTSFDAGPLKKDKINCYRRKLIFPYFFS
jgi:hypothetical protein